MPVRPLLTPLPLASVSPKERASHHDCCLREALRVRLHSLGRGRGTLPAYTQPRLFSLGSQMQKDGCRRALLQAGQALVSSLNFPTYKGAALQATDGCPTY